MPFQAAPGPSLPAVPAKRERPGRKAPRGPGRYDGGTWQSQSRGRSAPANRIALDPPRSWSYLAALNRAHDPCGGVAEWLNAPHSKCGIPSRVSGVRILSPPPSFPSHRLPDHRREHWRQAPSFGSSARVTRICVRYRPRSPSMKHAAFDARYVKDQTHYDEGHGSRFRTVPEDTVASFDRVRSSLSSCNPISRRASFMNTHDLQIHTSMPERFAPMRR